MSDRQFLRLQWSCAIVACLAVAACQSPRPQPTKADARRATAPAVTPQSNGYVVLHRGKDFVTTYPLRKSHHVLALEDDSLFVNGKPVSLSAVDEASTRCPRIEIFQTDDPLNIGGVANAREMILELKRFGKKLDRKLITGRHQDGANDYVTWLQTVPLNLVNGGAGQPPSADPELFDYYVMLLDTNPQGDEISKHYRVEAFPASKWQVGGACQPDSCDCERPDAQGVDWTSPVGHASPVGETHSGEGDENN